MRICENCGRELEDDETECPICGFVAMDFVTEGELLVGLWG